MLLAILNGFSSFHLLSSSTWKTLFTALFVASRRLPFLPLLYYSFASDRGLYWSRSLWFEKRATTVKCTGSKHTKDFTYLLSCWQSKISTRMHLFGPNPSEAKECFTFTCWKFLSVFKISSLIGDYLIRTFCQWQENWDRWRKVLGANLLLRI